MRRISIAVTPGSAKLQPRRLQWAEQDAYRQLGGDRSEIESEWYAQYSDFEVDVEFEELVNGAWDDALLYVFRAWTYS